MHSINVNTLPFNKIEPIKPPRKTRVYKEDALQMMCVETLYKISKPRLIVHHSPNEGKRTNGAKLVKMGMLAGFPDLMIIDGKEIHFIEFKSPKGRLSYEQEVFSAALHDNILKETHVVRTHDDFVALLKDLDLLRSGVML